MNSNCSYRLSFVQSDSGHYIARNISNGTKLRANQIFILSLKYLADYRVVCKFVRMGNDGMSVNMDGHKEINVLGEGFQNFYGHSQCYYGHGMVMDT